MSRKDDDIEISEDPQFEKRLWKVERCVWVVWALILFAALAGLLGPGAFSSATVSASDASLLAEYQRFDRYQAPAMLKIHVKATAASNEANQGIECALNRDFVQNVEICQVDPEPDSVEVEGNKYIYHFRSRPARESSQIVIRYEPARFGSQPVRITLNEQTELSFSQFYYP